MDAAAVASQLVKRWEGFRSKPYLCPAGVPTIGYGFTYYPNGVRVTLLDPPMDLEHAQQMLKWFLVNKHIPQTLRLCPMLEADQLGAIVDFLYNLGASNLRASTLRKRILAGALDQVPAELRKWVHGGGRVLPGLVLRREDESAYF